MIISTLVPHNYMMPFEVAKCWIKLPTFQTFFAEGPLIDQNRNAILKYALENEEDVLMIDSDVIFTPNEVIKMKILLREHEIVTGICPTLIDGKIVGAIYKKEGDEYAFTEPKEGYVDGCGGAFLGISVEALKKLPPDPFLSIRGKINYGEDLSFCKRVEEVGMKIWCDPKIKVKQVRIGYLDLP